LASDSGSIVDVLRDGADLRGVIFRGANLIDANFYYCDLSGADLSETVMSRAVLGWCKFVETDFYWACLDGANAHHAIFDGCRLDRANFGGATLSAARFNKCSGTDLSLFNCDLSSTEFRDTDLHDCDFARSHMIGTTFIRGSLSNCNIYGISVWDVRADGVSISELKITPEEAPRITVDDLDVAQFLYLRLEYRRVRRVVETVTGKVVLILGRFSEERKRILDKLRTALREQGFVSILFDFEKPAGRDLTEVVSLLAHMSCFVIADITDPKSVPHELQRIVPALPSVPVQPLIARNNVAYSMFVDFGSYPTVLPPFVYDNDEELLSGIEERLLPSVRARLTEIQVRREEFEETIRAVKRVSSESPTDAASGLSPAN
jgi:hypothetical protein